MRLLTQPLFCKNSLRRLIQVHAANGNTKENEPADIAVVSISEVFNTCKLYAFTIATNPDATIMNGSISTMTEVIATTSGIKAGMFDDFCLRKMDTAAPVVAEAAKGIALIKPT